MSSLLFTSDPFLSSTSSLSMLSPLPPPPLHSHSASSPFLFHESHLSFTLTSIYQFIASPFLHPIIITLFPLIFPVTVLPWLQFLILFLCLSSLFPSFFLPLFFFSLPNLTYFFPFILASIFPHLLSFHPSFFTLPLPFSH